MKPLWRIGDFIDLEYLLLRDDTLMEQEGQEALRRRDRKIYLEKIAPEVDGKQKPETSLLLNRWLKVRQQEEQDNEIALPGRVWDELYRIFWWGLLLLGAFTGAGLAFSFLAYSGAEPVNVSVYLGFFVGVQVLLLGLLGMAFLYRLLLRRDLHSSVLYGMIFGLMLRIMLRLKKNTGNMVDGRQRLQVSSLKGLVRGKIKTLGTVLLWPVFSLFQLLAIGFNLGALGATLLKVISSDIAFGWQSTLKVSEQFVFTLVKFVALPWSWFVPENIAYPSLLHIEGSQMILKEGIYHLATEDLVSWWPFLCLAVLFYGLLPRIMLLAVGLWFERRSLGRLQFKGTASRQLLQRMITPIVSTQAPVLNGSEHSPFPEMLQQEETDRAGIIIPDDQAALLTAVILVPADLYEQCPSDTLQTMVQKRLGMRVRDILRTGTESEDDQVVLGQLEKRNSALKIENIVILQEAWQPPILEFLSFLQRLRTKLDSDIPLYVALVGKPSPNTIFTPGKKEDLKIWRQKILAMGDPGIQVVELVAEI